MATISENLQIIADSTAAIKQAIIDKGGDVTGDITTWADAISEIETGGGSDNLKILSFGSTGSRVYVDGMTWGEWVDSIYNTRDQQGMFYKVSDTSPIHCSYGNVYNNEGTLVFASQLISDSITYIITQQDGGGTN